jgi:lysophospholipase L1-like esterase
MSRNLAYYLAGIATVISASCGGGGSDAPDSEPLQQPCTPVVVQMFGDSTQEQQGQNLQRYMDQRFGAGRVVVENLGVSGSTAAQMRVDLVKPGAVTASNYGINDEHQGVSVEAFKAALRRANTSIFETPNPTLDGYAPAVREVAAELGRPVIDVSAWVRAQPGWEQHVPDGYHPDEWLRGQVTQRLVGPAIGDAIAGRVCR